MTGWLKPQQGIPFMMPPQGNLQITQMPMPVQMSPGEQAAMQKSRARVEELMARQSNRQQSQI